MAEASPKLDQIGGKFAQLGGLGPFKFEKVLPAQAGSIKKRSDPQREFNREPTRSHRGAHFRDQLPPVPLKEDTKLAPS